jgi:hypothetical protein
LPELSKSEAVSAVQPLPEKATAATAGMLPDGMSRTRTPKIRRGNCNRVTSHIGNAFLANSFVFILEIRGIERI